ncbi:type II toxin-antitoxin system VapC family toxin [Atlantibacter sp.]|uniref:type II toxin-antitoxin system VapC family toxin n=1 Tax=Atlantibacter sp. TaxID=1903473 RepID=UPI0028A649F9|nr:type II toxin-antitoxin system VapC family toxin [Atlantibacter sp.]
MEGLALFDTNILIDLFCGHTQAGKALEHYPVNRAISLITWMEVMVGAKKYNQESPTREALGTFTVLPISPEVAERSVMLRQQHNMKLPDAIILATAQVNARQLITRNSKDFGGLDGVVIPYLLN